MHQIVPERSLRRLVAIGLLSWLAMLGIDFLIHGGLLASAYVEPSPFLLPSLEAFRRIPLGYLAALLLCTLLLWLMVRLALVGWRRGLAFGLQLGALIGGTAVLGLLSISTAGPSLLVAWFLSQTVEMGVAGMVAGSGLAGQRLRTLFLRVVVFVLVLVVLTIVLQNVGLAPAAQPGAP
jgi:hypothetical protein